MGFRVEGLGFQGLRRFRALGLQNWEFRFDPCMAQQGAADRPRNPPSEARSTEKSSYRSF